ncbi:MAG TPA: thiamine pyrophosphate-dependent enzyme, partial [Halobacteriales archaeon]|nr:thiamine pyrophosphate-dependent enzyme [Halobacteriales archaeon]
MTAERMTDERKDGGEAGAVPWLTQDDLPVETYRIVEPDGSYDPAALPDLSDDEFVDLYRWMRVEGRYGERMVNLQRRGEMGTVASGRGHEASIVGSGYALEDDDWLLGMGREVTAMFIQGVSMRDMILYWRGIEDASKYLAQHNCMIGISIGGHLPMVTGVAWGMNITDADSVVMAHFGDGATSTGASHEGINFAGVLDVPAIFYCQNNQWAISVPFEKQTNANTIAQRALGYGIP